jgi:hypothetical protein
MSSPWGRKCNTYGTLECRLPKDYMDTSQWRYCCGTSAMEKLMISHEHWDYPKWGSLKYYMIISCIHTHLFPGDSPLQMKFYKWLWHKHAVNELLYITFCGQMKHILCISVLSLSPPGTGWSPFHPLTWISSLLQHQHLGWNRQGHCLGPVSFLTDCSV